MDCKWGKAYGLLWPRDIYLRRNGLFASVDDTDTIKDKCIRFFFEVRPGNHWNGAMHSTFYAWIQTTSYTSGFVRSRAHECKDINSKVGIVIRKINSTWPEFEPIALNFRSEMLQLHSYTILIRRECLAVSRKPGGLSSTFSLVNFFFVTYTSFGLISGP